MIKEKKIYTAMNEAVFYYCIGIKYDRLKIFLKQVLHLEIYNIELKNTKLLKDYMQSREKTIDYLVLTNIGYINVEINNTNPDWLMNRNLSYACKVLANSIEVSQSYKDIKKVVQINLCRLGKTESGIMKYNMASETKSTSFKEILTDILEIYVVNVDFYKKMVYNGNKKFICDNYLLCAMDLKPKDIDKISEGNEELMEYKEDLEKINDNEDFVKWVSIKDDEEKIRNSYISDGLEEGRKLGFEQGLEQGLEQGIVQTAKNLLDNGIAIDVISKATGLSIEAISNLQEG